MTTANNDPTGLALARLAELGETRRSGNGWAAHCPAHDDTNASLSVKRGDDGRALLHCHAGCDLEDIVAGLGLTVADIGRPDHNNRDQWRVSRQQIHDDLGARRRERNARRNTQPPPSRGATLGRHIATYVYRDTNGNALYEKLRYEPKDFRVRRPGGGWGIGKTDRVLYNLPQIAAAITDGQPIVITEGEKDADRVVAEEGVCATTNYEGAAKEGQRTKWRNEYTEQLRGAADVVIVADRDSAGLAHAQAVADAIRGAVKRVWLQLPAPDHPKADLTDHFDRGYRLRDLVPVSDPEHDDIPDADEPATPVAAALEQPRQDPPLAMLPDEFWASRPVLGHIRQAAHSKARSADLVFHAVLARLSAMASPNLQFDTGIADGSLNYFTAAVSPSGIGKSTGAELAQKLLSVPRYLQPADDGTPNFRDGLPVGSGEGIVESFMGWRSVDTDDYVKSGPNKGERKKTQVRMQVRRNVFVFIDEGEALTKLIDRAGSTIGPILRSAWAGSLLGQANAREETTRVLERRSYSLGLLIGFQRTTCQALLADSAAGTPQRFTWCSALDPNVPDEPPDDPGPLDVDLGHDSTPHTGTITFADAIRRELWTHQVQRLRGDVQDNDLDSHRPLAKAKTAALLALLDGRRHVTSEDWALAQTVWDTSAAVRDALVDQGRRDTQRKEWVKSQRAKEQAVSTAAEINALPQTLARLAELLAKHVGDNDHAMTHKEAKRKLRGDKRHLYENAVQFAVDEGLLVRWERGIATPDARNDIA